MNPQVINLVNPLWLETLQKLRHDIYHLPEYVEIESRRTNTTPAAFLIVDDEKVFFMPYLLRKCDDILADELITQEETFDIVSPYGYSGILLSEAAASSPKFLDLAMNELKNILRDRNICSAFIRIHPILSHNFNEIFQPGTFIENGETVSVDLKLSESQIWSHTRRVHRNIIHRCKRDEFNAKVVPYLEYIHEFIEIYEETMSRVEAAKSYFFDYKYFLDLSRLGEKVHLCVVELEKEIISACLFFENCGIVQAHLGGVKTNFLARSPFILMFDYMRFWAKERGNEFFHLGGGIGGSRDSLHFFKTGFSRQTHNFLTLRLIIDEEKYRYLVNLRAKFLNVEAEELLKSDFFPAYRSPN